ncbi:biotin--protein ligase isoform X1 [Polypterus senegalus]
MLITLCYVYLWVRFQRCYTLVIKSTIHKFFGSNSFIFCSIVQPKTLQTQQSFSPHEGAVCLKLGTKGFFVTSSQLCYDLRNWTLLPRSSLIYFKSGQRTEQVAFVVEATLGYELNAHTVPSRKILKFSDYCSPLACSPGDPFKLIAHASVDNFSKLGTAFMEDRLQMDDGMVPDKIVSVQLEQSALTELAENVIAKKNNVNYVEGTDIETSEHKQMSSELLEKCSEQQSTYPHRSVHLVGHFEKDQNELQVNEFESKEDHHSEGHHLHLSSCHECLELENSTIESVKFASAEDIPDLPDDYAGFDTEAESYTKQSKRVNISGKPPNILIFTGSHKNEALQKYQQVKKVIGECISMDNYIIYHLQEEQILKDPWIENALLVVLATEQPIPEDLHKKFLTYLSKGGKILGLSSLFCYGAVHINLKDSLNSKISKMCYTKADESDVEFNVLTNGKTFEKEIDADKLYDYELWGHLLNKDKDMMIVRMPYGSEGGESILCQVHLEVAPDCADVKNPDEFNMLKVSNSLRYEILTEILTALGLNCELSEVPQPSPLYLIARDEKVHNSFLKWLTSRLDTENILKSSKFSLKVTTKHEPKIEPTEDLIPLITQFFNFCSEHFNHHLYYENLQTKCLGKIVLFAEVTPTTMDLLDGLMLHLPQEMGLIAIATQQTKGKGRAGNIWLSPVGCAMFTLYVNIPLQSKLGQRLPFLQHLVALAVVEAVRTLPGYEDINLRVKWPNDIYYSDLMKLGGVLVSSTIIGSTFHALVGCGFNVSNSNPTICINDLIVQYNKENGKDLSTLSVEQLISRTVTILENLISTFQEQGPSGVLPVYYKRWIHSGTKVQLWSEQGPQATVTGLDDYGFLQVQKSETDIVSVQPDGNSFDMLRNLIITKEH